MDEPAFDYRLPALAPGRRVRLVGRADRLLVGGLKGGAEIDTSGLTTREVVFTGPVEAGAVVRVRMAGGDVQFLGMVAGDVRVEVKDGQVAFTVPPAGNAKAIGGGARVVIAAQSVVFIGTVGGAGTRVEVTLQSAGSLAYTALDDSAQLLYRPADPYDPPTIHRGSIRGGAVLKRLH